MMRRGGRKDSVQGPWGVHDDAMLISALHLERGWIARNYVKVMVQLAACSIAISIIIWSLRPGRLPGPHLRGHNLQSRNPGFVFPLYHYYQQYPNGSHVVGGRERWRGSRGFQGRGVRSEESKPLFQLRGGHRLNDPVEIEQFYIEMKLGDPPKPFRFHIDTGSGPMWIYCIDRGYESTIATFGPNGLFVPKDDSYVKCIGATASECRALQVREEKCDRQYNYECIFYTRYADGSIYIGVVVNESIRVPMQDRTERNVFGLFGCVVQKELKAPEALPLLTDGVIGLGNCKGSLVDQLSSREAISQNVLGVCLAKRTHWSMLPATGSPAGPVGYVSLGTDFEEKFDQSKSVWAKLTDPGPGILCANTVKLLYISLHGRRITATGRPMFRGHEPVGMAMILDTGSELTYLHKDVYDQVLKSLHTYATNRDYFRVEDNDLYIASEQRACWEPAARKSAKASPLHEFRPLKLVFEGIASATERAPYQYLIIQPENYLTWDEDERKLCVNILQDTAIGGHSVSNLGAELMREHLFVFDFENQRVRWRASSNCEL